MIIREELRKMLDGTCEIFDLINEKTNIMTIAGAKGKLSNVLKYELMTFLMCLSACDGRISRVEAELIRNYICPGIYPSDIKDIIEESGIGNKEYFQHIPESIRISCLFDNFMVSINNPVDPGMAELVLDLFKAFGKEMVVADEKVKLEEQIVWTKYISNIADYAARHSDIFCKNYGEYLTPGKPLEINYEMSLTKIGRVYTIFKGKL